MIASISSELTRVAQRSTLFIAIAMVAFMIVSMIISVSDPGETAQDRGPAGLLLSRSDLEATDGLARSLGNAIAFVGIAAITFVAMNVGSEYTYGTIRNILIRQPNRIIVSVSKAISLMLTVGLVVAVVGFAGAFAAQLLSTSGNVDGSGWMTADGLLATLFGVLRLMLAACGWTAIGYLLAIVVRSAGAAIGIGVAWALPVEVILVEVLGDRARWLPGQILQTLARGGDDTMTHWVAAAGAVSMIVMSVCVATVVLYRRDVHE